MAPLPNTIKKSNILFLPNLINRYSTNPKIKKNNPIKNNKYEGDLPYPFIGLNEKCNAKEIKTINNPDKEEIFINWLFLSLNIRIDKTTPNMAKGRRCNKEKPPRTLKFNIIETRFDKGANKTGLKGQFWII